MQSRRDFSVDILRFLHEPDTARALTGTGTVLREVMAGTTQRKDNSFVNE